MIRRALTFLAVAVGATVMSLAGACRGAIPGDGQLIRQCRTVSGFDRVRLVGALDARIREAPAFAVTLDLDRNLLPLVRTRVDGHTLVIDAPGSRVRPSSGAYVAIDLPKLAALDVVGVSDVRVAVRPASPPVAVRIRGVATVHFLPGLEPGT